MTASKAATHIAPSPWLSEEDRERIQDLLRGHRFLDPSETVERMERAGEGNMNLTLRVITPLRTLILKQARPWVEKYPSIPAPVNRHAYESQFYRFVADHPAVQARMPKLLGVIAEHHILIIEDLGPAADMTCLYANANDTDALWVPELTQWLAQLHALPIEDVERRAFANTELRTLNHQHIAIVPFQTIPMLDLDRITPGLESRAHKLRSDTALLSVIETYGQRYLSSGDCLLHGDFYPGSWLNTRTGLRVIDPEFCFVGPAEFDVGVMLAHLGLLQNADLLQAAMMEAYEAERRDQLDWSDARRWAAVETLRRLLGVAQLPLVMDLDRKADMIGRSVETLRQSGR